MADYLAGGDGVEGVHRCFWTSGGEWCMMAREVTQGAVRSEEANERWAPRAWALVPMQTRRRAQDWAGLGGREFIISFFCFLTAMCWGAEEGR